MLLAASPDALIARPASSRKVFTPDRLAADFGPHSLAAPAVRALYQHLTSRAADRSGFRAWQTFFRDASGREPGRPDGKFKTLARLYGVDARRLRGAELLFAVHSYYALFLKQLALKCAAAAGDDLPAWVVSAAAGPFVREVTARLDEYELEPCFGTASAPGDLLKPLYQQLLPKTVRHALGEYYTPGWLAEHVLDQLGCTGDPGHRLLDPACGSGTFLVAAIHRVRRWFERNRGTCGFDARELRRKILANIAGFDLNPLAVMAARVNYLVALRGLPGDAGGGEVPVYLQDSILEPERRSPDRRVANSASTRRFRDRRFEPFDFIAGNPPWIAWDHLPAGYRRRTKPLWQQHGLFTLSAKAARHGGGKKDLSMLMLYASADRYLKPRGRLGFVITQTLFQTRGAGDGFRRFQLGDGAPLGVLRVDDLARFHPFDGAANWTSTIVLEKGRPTTYPVPYFQWTPAGPPPADADPDWRERFTLTELNARPIDPARPTSPWRLLPKTGDAPASPPVAGADYRAYLGANSGGANGVYWLHILKRSGRDVVVRNLAAKSKTPLPSVERALEPDLLYPLLRWLDVRRFHAAPSGYVLLAQDPQSRTGIDEPRFRRNYPKTLAYFRAFKRRLIERAAYRRYQSDAPFYSMYNVGPYTLAPVKVVWRRMDRRINAAVVGEVEDPFLGRRPVIPQETCAFIPCDSADEAHYLCALLNSDAINVLVQSHSVAGGKSFGSPGMLEFLPLKRFQPGDPRHRELAGFSRQAHHRATRDADFSAATRAIDRLVLPFPGSF